MTDPRSDGPLATASNAIPRYMEFLAASTDEGLVGQNPGHRPLGNGAGRTGAPEQVGSYARLGLGP
jgi:hypothetical protein